jgi:CheY-like chemotaxis protein
MPIPEEFQQTTKRILIVDDEQEIADSIERSLRSQNYETAIALDGFKAGVLIRSFKPSLVTLDLHMPGMSGFEVISYIRTTPELSHIKILVISALGSIEIQEAIRNGADDVLTKGFTKSELLKKLQHLL